MPNIFALELRLYDLGALNSACRRLHWEFRAGQRTYRWFGRPLPDRSPPRGLAPHEVGRCEHAIAVNELPPLHKDPFDRILVAQARVEGLLLLTVDKAVAKYGDAVRKV